MKNKTLFSVLITLCFILVTPLLSQAQDETVSAEAIPFPNGAREIPALTVPNTVITFDGLPTGPTSVQAINNAFPESTLTKITIEPVAGTDIWDSFNPQGKALSPNPDGSGGLYLVDPDQVFGNSRSYTFYLDKPTNEFGLKIGDQNANFLFEFYLGDSLVAFITIGNTDNLQTRFFQTRKPFNRVEMSTGPIAGWVLPELHLATGNPSRPIPTLSEWGLIAMAGILGLVGFIAIRKRYTTA